jgi:glyoxylase-like metal-dependent hydrolase (beta-lactamase superfamily II)
VVAPRVRRVLAPNPSFMTGRGTNTYLIGTRDLVVVDPGPDIPEHVAAILAAAAESNGRIVGMLLTHGHADHLGAAPALRAQTGAPIFGHPALPGVDHPLADGEVIDLGDETVAVYETPGHADDHVCYWLADDRLLFCGDLIAGVGTVVLSRTPGSLTRYLASLDRMARLGPQTILPGHGPVVADGLAKIQEYVDHRAMRERQVAQALRAGPATVDDLVRRIYVETPVELYAMAAHNVRAHLEHLAAQGLALRVGDEWTVGE